MGGRVFIGRVSFHHTPAHANIIKCHLRTGTPDNAMQSHLHDVLPSCCMALMRSCRLCPTACRRQ